MIRKSLFALAIATTLLPACNNNKVPLPKTPYEWEKAGAEDDTITPGMSPEEENAVADDDHDYPSQPAATPRQERRNYGDSRRHYDNMRGFDPASENDMDDNGMSRYMENNDDEGWD